MFNPTGEQLFGYSQAELIGVSIVRLLPELPVQGSLLRGLQAFTAEFTAGGGRTEARLTQARRKDGVSFPVELVASQVHIDRRDMYVICLRDITERLATEQALRDSETRYRTLVESAPEVIVVIDAHSGRCTDANENALQFFGIKRAQVTALDLSDLLRAAEHQPASTAQPASERGGAHIRVASPPRRRASRDD